MWKPPQLHVLVIIITSNSSVCLLNIFGSFFLFLRFIYVLLSFRKLEEELRLIEEQKAQWESTITGSTSGSRSDVHLEEAQVSYLLSGSLADP